MSSFVNSTMYSHLRSEPGRTMQSFSAKSDLTISVNLDSLSFSRGLQGSGKYTDNAFKSSLRSDTLSPTIPQPITRSKFSIPTSPAESMSARIPKPLFMAQKDNKYSARVAAGSTTLAKAKENNHNKSNRQQPEPLSCLLSRKTKLRSQDSVLKEYNREFASFHHYYMGSRLKGSGDHTLQTLHCTSLPTEPDSLITESNSMSIDINQQLRLIFRAGQSEDDCDDNFSIPEEREDNNNQKARFMNKPYVTRQKQFKLAKKF